VNAGKLRARRVGVDTAMDLETNVSKDFARDNSYCSKRVVAKSATVKSRRLSERAQIDIDALDFVHMYLNDQSQHHSNLHEFNDLYVLVNFRPVVTNRNGGSIAGSQAMITFGIASVFPSVCGARTISTGFWIQQPGICVGAHRCRANAREEHYMRNPLAMDVFNEETALCSKRKSKQAWKKLEDLSIRFWL